jgi:hypothetical protein
MSSAFAIAAVTSVLKDLLNNGMIDHDLSAALGNVTVTALPPDRIPVGNNDEKSQINLFPYLVTPNIGWRNEGLPSRDARGARLTNPPLALDLHYLITAYGAEEFHAEALLGYAMQLLHETPILTRAMINRTLKPTLPAGVTLPPGMQLVATSDLGEQIESIKICPEYLNTEEMSKLWTAMQAHYRPTAAYHLSVVLIESNRPTRSALPVLARGQDDQGFNAQANLVPPFPTIDEVVLPKNQASARPNDLITLNGHDFAGVDGDKTQVVVAVRLASQRFTAPLDIVVPPTDRDANSVTFTLPNNPAQLAAGAYTLTVREWPTGKLDQLRETSDVPLQVASRITGVNGAPLPANVARDINGNATLTLQCTPNVLPEQRVFLIVGDRQVAVNPRTTVNDPLTFVARGADAGVFWLRLRVDGADSLLVDRSNVHKPAFDSTQRVTVT